MSKEGGKRSPSSAVKPTSKPPPRLEPQLESTEHQRTQEEDPAELTLASSGLRQQLEKINKKRTDEDKKRVKEDVDVAFLQAHGRSAEVSEEGQEEPGPMLDTDITTSLNDAEDVAKMQKKIHETPFGLVTKPAEKDSYDQVQLDTWMSPMTDKLICTPFVYPIFFFILFFIQVFQARWSLLEELGLLKLKFQGGCVKLNNVFDTIEQWPSVYMLHMQSEAETVLKMMLNQVGTVLSHAVMLGQHILLMIISGQTTIYKCLATTVLTSSTRFLTEMVVTLQAGWNQVVNQLDQAFSTVVTQLNDQLTSYLGVDFTRLFGSSIGTKVELPNIRTLTQSLQIPLGFEFDLDDAINSMPSLNAITTAFEAVLSEPFRVLQQKINSSLSEMQDAIQLNITFHPPTPTFLPKDVCNDSRLTQLLTKFQKELDQWFMYSLYALVGAILLCLIYSMVQAYMHHYFTRLRIRHLSATQKSDMIWEMLDPFTFKLVQWIDHLVCLLRRLRRVDNKEMKAADVNAHLSRESKRNVARVIRFFANPPAMVFLLFCFTTLLFYYLQWSLIRAWKSQPELVIQPMQLVLKDLSKEVSLYTTLRIEQLYEGYLEQFNELTDTMAKQINDHVVNQYVEMVSSINGTITRITQEMLTLIDSTFAQVPAIQVTLTDLVNCFILQKAHWLQAFLNTVVSVTTFRSPVWKRPSMQYLNTLVQQSSDGWRESSTDLVLEFLNLYEQKLMKQIQFTWYMTAFAFGPMVCGVLFVIYHYVIRQVFVSKKKAKNLENSRRHFLSFTTFTRKNLFTLMTEFWKWHRKVLFDQEMLKRICLLSFIVLLSPLYLILGVLTFALKYLNATPKQSRRSGKGESKTISKKDIQWKLPNTN